MKIGVFGDCHLTKNMRDLQYVWDVTSCKSILSMYDRFDEEGVEAVVCLGDFFDAPRIEAKSMNLILPILEDINQRSYPTYFLLGNHEADDSHSNILEYLSTYENIIPVTSLVDIEGMLFIPYYVNIADVEIESHHIVFTHHDIYGSMLASGKVKASFGVDPSLLQKARLVMNGHVHLKSKVSDNIINAGSFLVSSQGELRVGDYPSYYTLDTNTMELNTFDNVHSMIYQAIDIEDTPKVMKYDSSHLVLRVDYEGEIPDIYINSARTSWRKKLNDIEGSEEIVCNTSNFDMKNYLVNHLKGDQNISENDKEVYIEEALKLLE